MNWSGHSSFVDNAYPTEEQVSDDVAVALNQIALSAEKVLSSKLMQLNGTLAVIAFVLIIFSACSPGLTRI